MTTLTPAAHYTGMTIDLLQERLAQAEREKAQLVEALIAAQAALLSYQYGNSSADLAEEIARNCGAALAAAQQAPVDKKATVWSYDISPPQGFIDYVAKNYRGEVAFHDPRWHALRLWNAAMRHVGPLAAVQSSAPVLRGSHIKETWAHGAGAYARCSYCGRYSDNPKSLVMDRFPCDCGKTHGWSGSFVPPTADSKWSDAAVQSRGAV